MAEKLVVRKTIAAPPREIFEAWTDADGMRSWMCPGDAVEARARLDVRVGGSFRIVMKSPTREYEHTGTYRIVDPPRKLVFTWISEATGGKTSLVTVEFQERGTGTEVVLTHEELPDPTAVKSHRGGWGTILDRLSERYGPGSGTGGV